MAFYNSGYYPGGSFFGDFPGGYRQTPGGFMFPSNVNSWGLGYPSFPGANLPSVDPNNYPGIVHYGPPTAIIESPSFYQNPFAGGYGNPMMGLPVF